MTRLLRIVAIGTCLIAATSVVQAQIPPEACLRADLHLDNGNNYGVTTPGCWRGHGQPDRPQSEFQSICWRPPPAGDAAPPDWFGFGLNLDLWFGIAPSEFGPRKIGDLEGSWPLLSRPVAHFRSPVGYLERPTVADDVDLITGVPLLQEVDFELAFGNAMFRHVRTYSEVPGVGWPEKYGALPNPSADGLFWDWTGQGWMMGENPIFLFDASYWSIASKPEADPPIAEQVRAHCYFIPDAHHSIPFERWEHVLTPAGTPTYVAPPQFDAIMTYQGGSWDGSKWTAYPHTVEIWLNGRSIKYTVRLVTNADVAWQANGAPGSLHAVAQNAGPAGVPYWGYVTKIEDRYGHSVNIGYCDFVQYDRTAPPTPPEECRPCLQNCHEKGQVTRVTLKSGEDVIWTLLYTHRTFENFALRMANEPVTGPIHHPQTAVNTIRVYRGTAEPVAPSQGPPATPDWSPCHTIPSVRFTEKLWDQPEETTALEILDARDAVDAVAMIGGTPVPVLPDNWEFEVRYSYSEVGGGEFNSGAYNEGDKYPRYYNVFGQACPHAGWGPGTQSYPPYVVQHGSPRLLKTTVTRRPNAGDPSKPEIRDTSHTLYRYALKPDGLSFTGSTGYDAVYLKAVYRPATVAKMMGALETSNPNELLLLADDAQIAALGNARFGELADQRFWHWADTAPSVYGGHADFRTLMETTGTNFAREMLERTGHANAEDLLGVPGSMCMFSRRESGEDGAETAPVYKMYRFLWWPDRSEWEPIYYMFRAAYHHPFRLVADAGTPSGWVEQTDGMRTVWIVVVDKYATLADCEADFTSNPGTPPKTPLNRRVVWVNAKGAVLAERSWNAAGDVLATHGLVETFAYDEHNRRTERRSRGWNCAGNTDPDHEGLIQVFAYGPDVEGRPSQEIEAIGYKRGEDGPVKWAQAFLRREPGRPSLVTHEVSLPVPSDEYGANGQPLPSGALVTETHYTFADPNDPESLIVGKAVVRPAMSRAPGAAPLSGVEKWRYDDKGQTVWHGYGSLQSWETIDTSAASPDEFYCDFTGYDGQGRPLFRMADALPGSYPGPARQEPDEVPAFPDGLGRHVPFEAGQGEALKHRTQYTYEHYGLHKTFFPNGRRSVVTVASRDPTEFERVTERREYNDLVDEVVQGQPRVVALSPLVVQLGTMESLSSWGSGSLAVRRMTIDEALELDPIGQVARKELIVHGALNGPLTADPTGEEAYTVIAELDPTYDAAGRVTGMAVNADGVTLEAVVNYNSFNQPIRSRAPDGTITRSIYDHFGRRVYSFRGTADEHEFWGTAPPGGPFNDNLVLTEKRYYSDGTSTATGPRDAGELTQVRHYRERPDNQYHNTGLPSSNEDEIGWSEQYTYDWRMRAVHVRYNAAGALPAAALRYSVTWFDNLDRVRLVAEYGPDGPPASPHPAAMGPADDVPPASEVLAAAAPHVPLRLTETIYNARGEVGEMREYDVSDSTAESYLASRTFYDHGGRVTYSVSPGGGDRATAYDAKGREKSSAVVAGGAEQTRTDTLYDPDGRAIETRSWERVLATGATLGRDNAVRTRVFNWYDLKDRLVVSAQLGTRGDQYSNEPESSEVARAGIEDPRVFTDGLLTGVNTAAWGDGAKVTANQYDNKGRLIRSIDAAGLVTANIYDDLGQLLEVSESAAATYGLRTTRRTAYDYDAGRLVLIAAILVDDIEEEWRNVPGKAQVTRVEYGAEVIDEVTGEVVSLNNALPAKVFFPQRDDILPIVPHAPDLVFQYYPDGLLATRTDAAGRVFRYRYDESGNQESIAAAYPAASPLLPAPVDLIRTVAFQHDPLGRLLRSTAWSLADATYDDQPVADTVFQYDPRGNLLHEWQQHGAFQSAASPVVDYEWEYSPAATGANYDRLNRMVYPLRPEASERRTLTFSYGDEVSGPDSALGRMTRIADDVIGTLGAYAYTGGGKRTAQHYGGEVGAANSVVRMLAAAHGGGAGYTSFDSHGRPADLHYIAAGGAGATFQRYQHGYDAADNLLYGRATLALHDNTRSSLYGYDKFRRLTAATVGELAGDNKSIVSGGSVDPRATTWTMDVLGNWNGDGAVSPALPGRKVLGPYLLDSGGGGVETFRATTQATAFDNRLLSIATESDLTGSATVEPVFDLCGNLVADESYVYQYDAWNRLMQVGLRGTLEFYNGAPSGGQAGPWIIQYTYDGLGRVIRKLVPWPQGGDLQQCEHYYYDGVRRIQETVTDPLIQEEGGGPGDVPPPVGAEEENGGDDGGGEPEPPQPPPGPGREFVWGPGAVDELLCQIDTLDRPYYALLDIGGNVTGIVDWSGALREQYAWDPYGELLSAKRWGGGIGNRVGHKGLFYDRLDAPLAGVQLAAGSRGLFQNRNRTYAPGLGRFVQRDPNATGQLTQSAFWFGMTSSVTAQSVDLRRAYSDGLSLFHYLGGDPTTTNDPLGLFTFSAALSTSMAMTDTAMNLMDYGYQGVTVGFSLAAMIDGYSASLLEDAEWAADWSSDDSWNSRSGVQDSAYYGLAGDLAPAGNKLFFRGGGPLPLAGRWHNRTRFGGLNWHARKVKSEALILEARLGPGKVRMNEALRDANGNIISKSRPDLQWIDAKDRVHVREIADSQTFASLEKKREFYQGLGIIWEPPIRR